MSISTLIILTIAVLIILYRIKTWSDITSPVDDEALIRSIKDEAPQKSEKPRKKQVQSTPKAEAKTVAYTKKYNAAVVKNNILVQAVQSKQLAGEGMEFKSQPKRGVTTVVLMTHKEDDRAHGLIIEHQKERTILMKSFDVKIAANGQFKVATSFSKSQAIKLDELKGMHLTLDHFMGDDEVVYPINSVSLTLK